MRPVFDAWQQRLKFGFMLFLTMMLVNCVPVATTTSAMATATLTPLATEEPNQLIETDTVAGIIFAKDNAAQMGFERIVSDDIDGYWTPSQADVLAFESKLGPYLKQTAPDTYPGPLKDLGEYKRQYVGLLIDGQRVIFTNFFCSAYDMAWQREFVFVMDGGSCFFELKYDVQTETFYDLSIHGES